ncbi:SDR family oxidoreductase [Pseudothermotoga thermarum]|uniref:NAD-dependent epimerase/dehydratase n=1 Tax=Pseudothermotoga thermarum DSM 5069 TaxID=688269 RepID=F7YW24_9THEM|nr:SDR family oxidoreductase [Pseudothermotoga thermarum]AEH50511.1 NAD-dependent epimerase/dehydratase [Pseudothermotoga thermarum DSM 5069]
MILVTGATGHLGNVLVRLLVVSNKKVRVLVLPNEDLKPLEDLNVEIVRGDVRDFEAVNKACKNVEVVYHLAAVISIFGKSKLVYEVNVEGTKNVLRACMKNRVSRMLYVSSVHAFAELAKGSLIDENVPIDPKLVTGHYAKSKAMATQEVLKAVKEGFDAVLIFPTGIIGPYDWRLSEMGSLIVYFCGGMLKLAVGGGFDFVDVRDVAKAMILALEKADRGEKFILSGEYVTIRALIEMLERIVGKKPRVIFLPNWTAYLVAMAAIPYYKLKNQKPLLTFYSVFALSRGYIYSNQKARQKLDFSPMPVFESLKDAVDWFAENGYVVTRSR